MSNSIVSPAASGLCEYLPWDSDFFKYPVAQIAKVSFNEKEMLEIVDWCIEKKIRCLYFLGDINDLPAIHLAERYGMHFIDIRVTLEFNRAISTLSPFFKSCEGAVVRRYEPRDLARLIEIAKVNHPDSRFYKDRNFSQKSVEELYGIWIKKCCTEWNEIVFVCTIGPALAGYLSCKIIAPAKAQIILAGVETAHRKKGIGSMLIKAAFDHCLSVGCESISVTTQASNINAMRLYTSNGFFPAEVRCWYHKWFT